MDFERVWKEIDEVKRNQKEASDLLNNLLGKLSNGMSADIRELKEITKENAGQIRDLSSQTILLKSCIDNHNKDHEKNDKNNNFGKTLKIATISTIIALCTGAGGLTISLFTLLK